MPFIDRLQKAYSREFGFLPTMAIAEKIELGQVLVAEVAGVGAGYCIAADRYLKRDELGYVTQVAVRPEYRRHLVAAALLQAQFDRSASGCRLYCCWCVQDLKANDFWAAMGFTAFAFRTGSRTKGRGADGKSAPRIHLFWQKRVRAGNAGDPARGGTPWWYPATTGGGELREDRIVFPIPPGVGWRDVLPAVLSEAANAMVAGESDNHAMVEAGDAANYDARNEAKNDAKNEMRRALPSQVVVRAKKRSPDAATTTDGAGGIGGGLWFGGRRGASTKTDESREAATSPRPAKKPIKIDLRLATMARELRDRWGEQAAKIPALPANHNLRRMNDAKATRRIEGAVEAVKTVALIQPAFVNETSSAVGKSRSRSVDSLGVADRRREAGASVLRLECRLPCIHGDD